MEPPPLSLTSVSSEFLQMEDNISKIFDSTISRKTINKQKSESKSDHDISNLDTGISTTKKLDSETLEKKISKSKRTTASTKGTSSTATSILSTGKKVKTASSSISGTSRKKQTKNNKLLKKTKTKSKRAQELELTAMEIWERNVGKDYSKYHKQHQGINNKSSAPNNENNSKKTTPFPEMMVGVGVGATAHKSAFIKGSTPRTAAAATTLTKLRQAKKAKGGPKVLAKTSSTGVSNGSNSAILESTNSESGESPVNTLNSAEGLGGCATKKSRKGRGPSWQMNIQEIENFIAEKNSEKKSENRTRKVRGVQVTKCKDAPITEITTAQPYNSGDNMVRERSDGDFENAEMLVEDILLPDKDAVLDSIDGEGENQMVQDSSEIGDQGKQLRLIRPSTKEVSPVTHVTKIVPPLLRAANMMQMSQYLSRVQTYFDQLGYHREGEPSTTINLRLSIKHLMSTAKGLIKVGQPIKCLHALVLAVYFTNHVPLVERFPIHFKSKVKGREFKHVVLGVYVQGHFGALGISRDQGLQDKPATYLRLADLINNYYQCYNQSGHFLKELKIGNIITHDPHSIEHLTWKLGKVSFDLDPEQIEIEIEKISRKLRSQMGSVCLRGVRLDQYNPGPPLQQRPTPKTGPAGIIRPTGKTANQFLGDPIQTMQRRSRSIPSHPSDEQQLPTNPRTYTRSRPPHHKTSNKK